MTGTHAPTSASPARGGRGGIVGVNIGANKDSADRIADYEAGVRRFADVASYLTVNISSPNTPGLRGMQERQALAELLSRVMAARDEMAPRKPPVFLKIAPDLGETELADIAAEVLASKVEGVIVSNTTLARTKLHGSVHRDEAGGLSGRPLFERSTAVLARMRRLLGPDVALVGVGGVDSSRSRDREDPRGRRPRAALHRHDLRRPVAARPHRQRSRRILPAREDRKHRPTARQQRRPLGRQTYRLTASLGGKGLPDPDAQPRQQAEAAHQQEHVQRRPQPVISEERRQRVERQRDRPRTTAASCCACRATRSRR